MAKFFATGQNQRKQLTPPIIVKLESNELITHTLVGDSESDPNLQISADLPNQAGNKFYHTPDDAAETQIDPDDLPIEDENGTELVDADGVVNLGYVETVDDPAAEEDTGDNPSVNGAITDAVTQANVKVLADSPAMSLSNLYQTVSQSLSLSVQNAVTMQQQNNILHQATTTQGVNLLYTVGTAAVGMAASEALESDTSDNLVNMLSSAIALNNQK
ncbi:MAG: RebB family R body protein [Trichodesmium sp. St19_bin1]|nr:RebB family R body protein [Trichodesmium sp. St19_bin1]